MPVPDWDPRNFRHLFNQDHIDNPPSFFQDPYIRERLRLCPYCFD